MWEVTFFEGSYGSAKTVHWSTEKCVTHFGPETFDRICEGYVPDIVAVKGGGAAGGQL